MPRLAANLDLAVRRAAVVERFGAAAAAGFSARRASHSVRACRCGGAGGACAPWPDATWHQHAGRPRGRVRACGAAGPRARMAGRVCARARLRRRDRRALGALPRRRGPAGKASGGRDGVRRQSRARRRGRGEGRHHAVDRAAQPARPAGLFPHPRRARRRYRPQGRRAEPAHPVRFLSRADRVRRSDPPLRRRTCR